MSKATHNEAGWEVLAQPTGEVLTAEARSPGLLLGLLGVPRGFEARDAEGWLYDVAGVSHESSTARPAKRPIPAILEHALTGLLFSHAELWEQPGDPMPCSYAFIEARGEIGFGWVGEAKVSVWVDGEPRETGYVALRDGRGREGRAWSIPSYHNVQVRISWLKGSASDAGSGAGGAEVEASWIADGRSAPGYHPVPIHTPWAAVETLREPEVEVPASALAASILDFPQLAGGEETIRAESVAEASDPAVPALVASAPVEIESAREESRALREPIPLVVEAVNRLDDPRMDTKPERGFGAWLKRTFGWLRFGKHEEDEVDEDEVWRVAAEETVDLVATGTDDAIGFPIGAAPAPGPTLHLAERPAMAREPELSAPEVGSWQASSFAEAEAYAPTLEIAPGPGHVEQGAPGEPEESGTPGEPLEEWGDAADPHAINLPSLEPAARLARIEESLRRVDHGLELVGVTPEESDESTPGPDRFAEPSASEREIGLERVGVEEPYEYDEETAHAEAANQAADEAPGEAPVAPGTPAASLPPSWTAISPQRPAWPTPQELARTRRLPLLRQVWPWAALVAVLFAGGWLVGGLQQEGRPRDASHRGRLAGMLHAVGLGGPRYQVQVTSRPPGAWIAVDGQALTLRTPAAIEATPGEHVIGLSFPDHGTASFPVRGRKGENVPLDAALWGALDIVSPDEVGVIGVSVDGVSRGFAPLRVDSLAPGVHEVRFSAPGIEPWGQTVEIQVRETRELLSRAVQSPSSGVLDVQASLTDENGSQPLKGAQVFIDGERRGLTPLVLDLPRGPHSVRLVYKEQQAPIQVIDLPGGNQRFAVFEMGVDSDSPRLTIDVPPNIPRDRPAVISATAVGASPGEVREMWLHVQMPEGAWRRYAMTMLKGAAGAAGVVTFPTAAFDSRGKARYYVSAQSGQGDEIFTELRTIWLEAPPAH